MEDLDKIFELSAEQQSGFSPSSLTSMEKEHIENMLAEVAWNRTEAARRLGISLPTLRSKIRKYGIVRPDHSE